MTASTSRERTSFASAAPHAQARAGRDAWTWVLVILAVGNFANAAWMLGDPRGWFIGLPAAVPDFGPLNEHFVRDIGAAFAVFGAALLWAAFASDWRVPLIAPVTLFYVLHALAHVYDTARGLVGPAHWTIDLPGVYVPALLMIAVLWLVARPRRRAALASH